MFRVLGGAARLAPLVIFVANRNVAKDWCILRDLIAEVPGDEGKWFATAKDLGELDLAIELVSKSPCDPKTLNRAAAKYLESNPEFAMNSALASLRWLCEGYGYEITNFDVIDAHRFCMTAAKKIGKLDFAQSELKKHLSSSTSTFVKESIGTTIE
jgi:hypothetical protein